METQTTTNRRIKSRRRPASQARQRPSPNKDDPQELNVTLTIPPHVRDKLPLKWIVGTCTKSLLMHTLYARGVCPLLASETIRVYRQYEETKQKATPMERKFIKFGASLSRLLEEWSLLCSCANVQRALITLGPSWSRPREFYILDFGCCCDNHDTIENEIMEPGLKHEHALSRRLTRVLLDGISNHKDASCLSHPSPHGSSYMVHLSVWIQHQEAQLIFEKSTNVTCPLATVLQSCILRTGFSISSSSSNRSKRPHVVTAKVSSCNEASAKSDWKEGDGVWLSLPTSLKGFRV